MSSSNGWVDPIVQKMSKPVAETGAQSKSRSPREIQAAVANRKLAEMVLSVKGSYLPSLAAMREELSVPETSASVKEQVEEVKARHVTEMQRVHDILAEEYLGERVDAYLGKDDAIDVEEIESFYVNLAHRGHPARSEAGDILSSFRYSHDKTLLTLIRRRAALAWEEEQARRKRDAQFPGSISEWWAIKDKDVQARIARFLMASKAAKERMLEEYGWAYRQVKPLEEEYANNQSFMTEAQRNVRDHQATHDPRRKSLSSSK